MDKKTVDGLLAAMVQSEKGISDLLFIDGKTPLLYVYGRLCEFPLDPPGSVPLSDLIQGVADHMMGGNERLLASLAATGSCDCSYEVDGIVRLRVNIYKTNGRHAIVMRRFPSAIPTPE